MRRSWKPTSALMLMAPAIKQGKFLFYFGNKSYWSDMLFLLYAAVGTR